MKTVVGLFKTVAQAQQVKQSFIAEGYEPSQVAVVANDEIGTTDAAASSTSSETGIGHKISDFFSNLVGGDEHAHNHYASGINQGGALLTVKTSDDEAVEVAALLKDRGASEIEGDYENSAPMDRSYRSGEETVNGATAIPVVEEELVVGKRDVDRGGVRVYSHVVERPVSADVTLHNERVNVERRPVNRPATAADFQTGSNSFEVRATGEEAVVGKTSRVVEEVLVGTQESEHTEKIQDKVRRTEVEVEQFAGESVKRKN